MSVILRAFLVAFVLGCFASTVRAETQEIIKYNEEIIGYNEEGFEYCAQQSHLDTLWPSWVDNTIFVQCAGIHRIVIQVCPPSLQFMFTRQQCVWANEWVPPPSQAEIQPIPPTTVAPPTTGPGGVVFEYCTTVSCLGTLWPSWTDNGVFVQCISIRVYGRLTCPLGLWFGFWHQRCVNPPEWIAPPPPGEIQPIPPGSYI